MTLAQIETIFWVARLGSTQATARQLNLAQPTISLRLRDLETALDVRLFDRVGRGLTLTHEGGVLLERVSAILNEVTRIGELSGAADYLSAVVRVGLPETFALVCLPALVRNLQAEHPALRMEFFISTSTILEARLLRHELDISFLVDPTSDPRLRLTLLGLQETCWCAAPSFGLSSPVRPADLQHLPIISNAHPSAMHKYIGEWFRSGGLEPPRLNSCNSLSVMCHLVRQGIFVGFLPRKMLEAEFKAGTIQNLASRPPVPGVRIYGGHLQTESSPAVLAILREARRVVEQFDFLRPV
ncbi:MAG: LysR family transcriptional regulator [Geminicoccaceae bacterium]